MDNWIITPFVGIGELKFGLLRADVKAILGHNFTSRKRGYSDYDAYYDLGTFLYFDKSNKLEFIEMFSPCDPIFSDVHLLNENLEQTLEQLAAQGYKLRKVLEGYSFDSLGIVFYQPVDSLEAVAIYRENYYSDYGITYS